MKIVVEEGGERLDVYLFKKIGKDFNLSRSTLAQYIPQYVLVNDEKVKKSRIVEQGDEITVDDSAIQAHQIERELDVIEAVEGPLNIIEEGDEYIVLNKAKGVAVHPGKDNLNNTIANYLKYYLQSKNNYDSTIKRAGIVHRLDKLVGGILLCAKTRTMQLYFQKRFEKREVSKIYLATLEILSSDIPASDSQLIEEIEAFRKRNYEPDETWIKVEGYIKRSNSNRMKMELLESGDKYSLSYVKILENNQALINIKTGRMHQIRATLNKLGWVVYGDKLYGSTHNSDGIELSQILLSVRFPNGEAKEWSLI